MLRTLYAGTALAALATPLAAQTVIDDDRTTPVRTSTVNDGAPGAIRIDEDGSIKVGGGAAVTVDSNHDVTNEGAIAISNADGASGIAVDGDRTADIVNSGTITINETYTPEDADKDGDLDGPFAVGSDRAGIRVRGALTGNIVNSGTIAVEGNDSAGIVVEDRLTGKFTHDGKTTVVGDGSTGVALDDVTGDVRLAGTIGVQGEDAVGARLSGDIGGTLTVQGGISATGYRSATAPSDASKLDADDLLQGGSALIVEGDVAEGIVFAAAPPSDDEDDDADGDEGEEGDEDGDGGEDGEGGDDVPGAGTGRVVSAGAAPAVVIGGAEDIAVGAVPATGTGFGVIVQGEIAGSGVYAGVDGNGLVVGGQGGAVAIANGIGVSGKVTAASRDSAATAIRLGTGADVPELRNSGTIAATSGNDDDALATAVAVDAGADMPLLRNTGTISAKTGARGTAVAIVDESGTLTTIENAGEIVASGATEGSGRNVALDVTAVTSGATVRQTQVAEGIDAPSIVGDVRFGSGADMFSIADGTVKGDVTFGAGTDRLELSGDGSYQGDVDFGGQADELALTGASRFSGEADFGGGAGSLSLGDTAVFSGALTGSDNLVVDLSGGVLDLRGSTTIGSLDVGADGVIVATLDQSGDAGTAIDVGGTASFEEGAKFRLRVTDIASAEGSYLVLTAGDLVGADGLDTDSTLVPFLYDASLAIDDAAGEIAVDITRKATEDLGLNRSQASAFDAFYAALANDDDVANVFLGVTDGEQFGQYVAQILPDHAGGSFEGVSLGVRTFARRLADPQGPFKPEDKLRVVLDFAGWDSQKDAGETASYDLDGLGFSGGLETTTGVGDFGVTGSWLWSRHDSGYENTVISNTYEAAAYWRGTWGGLSGFARGSYGFVDFEGSRFFTGEDGEETLERLIDRDWSGNVVSFIGGASFETGSQYLFVRPSVMLDYIRLSEDGYTETGGGEALDLTVSDRTSDETGLNLALAAGADLFGMGRRDDTWLRLEAEGGWREIVAGELGGTTASFADGDSFTLLPEQRASGWFARLRGMGGDEFYSIGGELSAEERNEEIGYALRATLRFGF
ncbi:autotransporter domain-containing protein [Pelagerythrobacter sp.]|uniref:autotransporter domain-containing protein n=1 Tax=Pelagerythrobacter sp. TaxID=2800702 RepID=UPI0035B460A6